MQHFDGFPTPNQCVFEISQQLMELNKSLDLMNQRLEFIQTSEERLCEICISMERIAKALEKKNG